MTPQECNCVIYLKEKPTDGLLKFLGGLYNVMTPQESNCNILGREMASMK